MGLENQNKEDTEMSSDDRIINLKDEYDSSESSKSKNWTNDPQNSPEDPVKAIFSDLTHSCDPILSVLGVKTVNASTLEERVYASFSEMIRCEQRKGEMQQNDYSPKIASPRENGVRLDLKSAEITATASSAEHQTCVENVSLSKNRIKDNGNVGLEGTDEAKGLEASNFAPIFLKDGRQYLPNNKDHLNSFLGVHDHAKLDIIEQEVPSDLGGSVRSVFESVSDTDLSLVSSSEDTFDSDEEWVVSTRRRKTQTKSKSVCDSRFQMSLVGNSPDICNITKRSKVAILSNSPHSCIPVSATRDRSATAGPRNLASFGSRGCKQSLRELETDDTDSKDFAKRIAGTVPWSECQRVKLSGGGLEIPSEVWGQLHGYQQEAVQWLSRLYQQEVGGILGDEMGMGKTVEMATFVAALHYSNVLKKQWEFERRRAAMLGCDETDGRSQVGGVLIACPATVLRQWLRELHIWCPPICVCCYHQKSAREMDKAARISSATGGVLLTTYETLRTHLAELLKFSWKVLVLDEGQKIRNPDAAITLAVKKFPTPHRYLLSASPLQNSLAEFWSICDFCAPGKLGTLPVFQEEIADPIRRAGYQNASRSCMQQSHTCATLLQRLIGPFFLRRRKADYMNDLKLPRKTEEILLCSMMPQQFLVYVDFLKSLDGRRILKYKHRKRALYALTMLRKIANHPDLLMLNGGKKPSLSDFGNPERSGKLKVSRELMRHWWSEGHKALVFAQTIQALDMIEQIALDLQNTTAGEKQFRFSRLDGTTPISRRHRLIKEFHQDSGVSAMLLTTRVGGVGVNLTAASRVLLFDPDWNPMTDIQARERTWRIGQTKDVVIYRLILSGSLEEKIYQRQLYKQFLSYKVLDDARQSKTVKWRDMHELFEVPPAPPSFNFTSESAYLSYRAVISKHFVSTDAIETDVLQELRTAAGMGSTGNDCKIKGRNIDAGEVATEMTLLNELLSTEAIKEVLPHDLMAAPELDRDILMKQSDSIAVEAMRALRESQKDRMSHGIDVPTWTGKVGKAGMACYGPRVNNSRSSSTPVVDVRISSASILAGLRQLRSSLLQEAGPSQEAEIYTSPSVNSRPRSPYDSAGRCLARNEDLQMAGDLLKFFLSKKGQGYSAPTGEILEEFTSKVPDFRKDVFKAILKNLCEFVKSPDPNKYPCHWRLKRDYQHQT